MGLAIAVFVPEGIVFASDGLAEIRNSESDNGFLQKKQKSIFSYKGKFLVCIQGSGYINGLPYSYYIRQIFAAMNNMTFATTESFCVELKNKFAEFQNDSDHIVLYVAGIDNKENTTSCPMVFLLDNMQHQIINKSNNGDVVYNYHSIGRSLWLNKLLLPTSFEQGEGKRINFENLDVDFSKYSLNEAIVFAKSMIEISCKMDNFVQIKQMIGEYITIGYITIDNEIQIKNHYE